jgi:hypothetical protein
MLISLTRWSLAHPLLATTITAVITVGFGLGIPRVQRETTVRTFLGADHEAVRTLDEHIATFGGAYPVIIAYSCNESPNCSSIFDESALTMAAGVAGALARVYGVRAVHSPATTPLLLIQGGDLVIQRLMPEDPAEIRDRKALVAMAAADPRWRRTLIGPDGIVGAIVVDVASSESQVQESIAKALTEILAPYEQRGWTYHLVGELVDFAFSGVRPPAFSCPCNSHGWSHGPRVRMDSGRNGVDRHQAQRRYLSDSFAGIRSGNPRWSPPRHAVHVHLLETGRAIASRATTTHGVGCRGRRAGVPLHLPDDHRSIPLIRRLRNRILRPIRNSSLMGRAVCAANYVQPLANHTCSVACQDTRNS